MCEFLRPSWRSGGKDSCSFFPADGLVVRTICLGDHGGADDAIEVEVGGEVVYTAAIVDDPWEEAKLLAIAVKKIYDHGFGSA